jgi:hypothetical protein
MPMENISIADTLHLLHLARAHIRSRTRSPSYFKHASRFSAAFLGEPLGVEPEYYDASGTDLTIIDFCYEQLLSKGEAAASALKKTTLQLQEMATPSSATLAMPALRVKLEDSSCSLLDVACGSLAAITLLGQDSLLRKVSLAAADRWLALWQDLLSQQDHQQELHCGMCLLTRLAPEARSRVIETLNVPLEVLRPKKASFGAGVDEYLERFSETGAVGVLIIGGLPFAERLTSVELEELIDCFLDKPEFLHLVTKLIRFAQDVSFDPQEPINSGVFALAMETGVSVVDVDAHQVNKVDIDEKLRRQWDLYSQECRRRLDVILAAVRHREALHRALAGIVDGAFLVAQLVESAPHKQ